MAPVRSFLSTYLLAHQLRGPQAFAETFAGEWLVWEPGPWQAPPRGGTATLKVDATALTPQHGNALCYHLGPATGRSLSVGRDPQNEVQITDGTVSRRHVTLSGENGTWRVLPSSGRDASLGGKPIPEAGAVLAPGSTLVLGGVALTFHDTASFMKRLVEAA